MSPSNLSITDSLDILGLTWRRFAPGIYQVLAPGQYNPLLIFDGPGRTPPTTAVGLLALIFALSRNVLVDGPTVVPAIGGNVLGGSSKIGNYWELNAGGSRTFAAPSDAFSSGPGAVGASFVPIILRIKNTTGGAIVTTFDPIYKLAGAWVDPAAGKMRFLGLLWNLADLSLAEIFRTPNDITP